MLETNQPVKPFLGVRFVLIGFDSIEEPNIRYKLIDGGGVDSGQYNPNCTHVIVNKIVYDDPICVAARKDCKTVVTGLWVDHSYDIGMPVDFTSVMYRPPKDLNGIPGAKNLVVCLTGYQRQDRDDIMTLVGLMGAQFSKPLVANKITHLICYKFEGEKYELGKKLSKIKLVNHRWLEDCLKEWKILPEANYNKSGYELEMMEAEAKDSEDEAEDATFKQLAVDDVQKSPFNSKPIFSQTHNSPKLGPEMLKVKDPANVSDTNDKSSVQGIDFRSEQTSGLDNILTTKSSGHHDVGGLKETTYSDLAQPHYQSPFRKHTLSDLTPNSRKTEGSPYSDGKFGAISHTRSVQRSLGDLSSNHCGFGKEVLKANDLLSSYSKPDQAKGAIGSDCFEPPQKGDDLLAVERPTVYPPQRSMQTSSYGTPDLHKIHNEEPCIRKTTTPSNKITGANSSFFNRLHNTDIIEAAVANNEIASNANPAMDSWLADMVPYESIGHDNTNENTSPSSFKRLKTSLSGSADAGSFDARNLTLPTADIRESQNHLKDAKGSATSNIDRESNEPPSVNPKGTDSSNTKPLTKKVVAKKTLGSRPKIASNANKKGSLYLDIRSLAQDEAVVSSNGQENEAINAGICYPISSNEAPETAEIKAAPKSTDIPVHKTETLDDETETPDDKVEQILNKGVDEENVVSVGLGGKTDTVEGKEADARNLSNEVTFSPCPAASKPSKQANVLGNVEGTSIPAAAVPKLRGDGLKRKDAKRAPAVGKKKAKKIDVTEGVVSEKHVDGEVTHNETEGVNETENEKKEVKRPAAKSKHRKACKNKLEKSAEEEKENTPVDSGAENKLEAERDAKMQAAKFDKTRLNNEQGTAKNTPNSSMKAEGVAKIVRSEPKLFILSGHRFQRREFQKIIRHLKGRFCRDSHQWSYQATHFIVPDPIRRTEKFFAAAASGRWILKTDYLTASNEAGKFLKEEDYEWHKNGLNEDGAINLEAPRKWRLLRQRTGHGAFHGMRIIIYGECIAPPLDTLKRVVKSGDGAILATSPPYTRFLNYGVDFAVVSPGMPRVDAWVQEFLKHEVPCVVADYLVEYVCKPGYSLDKHVLYNSHAWAEKSFARLKAMAEEVVLDSPPSSNGLGSEDDTPCKICGSRDRGDVMLICGDENGLTGCGVGCHIDCCDPPLENVPADDWFCSDCNSGSNTSEKSKRKKGNSGKKK